MFKRIISILLVSAIFFSFSGFASSRQQEVDISTPEAKIEQSVLQYPATNEDFRYDVYTYYIVITQCLSTKSNIIIPDTIQDLPVYIIAAGAFADQTAITSVSMSNNVIEIRENAFAGCVNLASVNLPKNLKTCGGGAFSNCDNIKAITIPASLSVIPSGMFGDCDRLSAVTIEDSSSQSDATAVPVERIIEGGAFGGCPMLKNVWIPDEITNVDGGAFNGSTDNLTIYGAAQSSAAHYASEHLLDFVVLDKSQFKNIMNSSTATEKVTVGNSIESDTWKITLESVYSLRGKFNYINGAGAKREKVLNNGNEVVLLCFSVKNLSAGKQNFNFLELKASINNYYRKISSFGKIEYNQFSQYNNFLNGEINPGDIMYGYIAIETSAGWKNASVQFMNDTILESFSFEVNSDSKNVTYIGTAEAPVMESATEVATTTADITDTTEYSTESSTVEDASETNPNAQ